LEKYNHGDVEITSHYSNIRAKKGQKGPLLEKKEERKMHNLKILWITRTTKVTIPRGR